MFEFLDPYSIKSLRKRASLLPESPYRLCLELSADQLENNKVSKQEVKKAIEYIRTNNATLLMVAFKMLNLNPAQIDIAINLLEDMK